MSGWKIKTQRLATLWLTVPVLWFLARGIIGLFFGGFPWGRTMDMLLMKHILSGGGVLWALLVVGFLGSAVIVGMEEFFMRASKEPVDNIISLATFVSALIPLVLFVSALWNNDKDQGRYYNDSTEFVVPEMSDAPASVKHLVNGATQGDSECQLRGAADVSSCINEGVMDSAGWEPRIGSLDGAIIALTRASGDSQRVSLNTDTMAYLNVGNGNEEPRWSGILDGSEMYQPLAGVAEWSGSGSPQQCLFEGEYKIDRAFAGTRSNNLKNLLAEKYPDLRWNVSDVWGYCKGDEPIVVVPMIRPVYYGNRTVDTAGGIVTVRGDSGKTKLTYVSKVEAGEYPGPVYPASLAVKQRENLSWAAGRANMKRNGFGFDPANSDAQAGNVSEYLLRNESTGRLEWVTPLTLRDSTSELFVAYSIVPADEVDDRQLNRIVVYVFAEDDPRRVNIDNLEADARNYLANNAGTFISNGGNLIEFTPVDGDTWRAFGELNGRVVYRLDISAGGTIKPQLVAVGQESSGEDDASSGDTSTELDCGGVVGEMAPAQLAQCLQVFADELVARQQANVGN